MSVKGVPYVVFIMFRDTFFIPDVFRVDGLCQMFSSYAPVSIAMTPWFYCLFYSLWHIKFIDFCVEPSRKNITLKKNLETFCLCLFHSLVLWMSFVKIHGLFYYCETQPFLATEVSCCCLNVYISWLFRFSISRSNNVGCCVWSYPMHLIVPRNLLSSFVLYHRWE